MPSLKKAFIGLVFLLTSQANPSQETLCRYLSDPDFFFGYQTFINQGLLQAVQDLDADNFAYFRGWISHISLTIEY
jgi:hypothetical protein